MQEEIRVITLVRKENLTPHEKTSDEGMEERFFTTDYFDMLITKRYSLDVPLNQWMSEDSVLTDYSQETAVQRYPLYFSKSIYDKYEKSRDELKRGDPFEKSSDFKFLSVIQVYIAPEILKRLKDKMSVMWCAEDGYAMLDPFLNDLYDTVECFRCSYQSQEFVYRIYYAMSAGDFTIVIKSRIPELSFGISTYVRSRISGKKWAVYKTYTLLAMEDDIDGWENGSVRLLENGSIGKFVLRGCYSWKYWKERPGNEYSNRIDRLNGRYDFSVELTEKEFVQFYHKVLKNNRDGNKEAVQLKNNADYLADLMDRGYLSYLNERYLMPGIEIGLNDADIVSKLVLDNKNDEELNSLNRNFINSLRQKQQDMEKSYAIICREHKSLKHYFVLLKRQIDFCSVLNEQSDTRIYACGIEQLLEAVLDSLGKYKDVYQEEESGSKGSQLGGTIVEYLGKSIYSINTYMEYVRNNNLQSLQTPNYNIESDMGMEKILIGYSEYLREFVRFYVENNDCMSGTIGFLPIVIPNICDSDIKVETLFPNDKIFNPTRKTRDDGKKLLIINSPSMMELEDIPMAMSMLCHEIAHRFRYEDRKDRNRVILRLFAAECAEMVTKKILARLLTEIGEVTTYPPIETILRQELSDIIVKILTSAKYGIDMDAPMDYFRAKLNENILKFFQDFSYISKMDKYTQLFIRQVTEWKNVDEDSIELAKELYEAIDSGKDRELCLQKIEKAVREYLGKKKGKDDGVIYLYMEDLIQQLVDEEQNDTGTETQQFIVRLHERLADIWEKRTLEHANRIGKTISVNEYRMWALTGRYLGLDAKSMDDTKINEKNRDRFMDVIKQLRIEEKDLEAVSNSISLYREITSDIFMCCVMGLSPFAYLNVIVTNMWRTDLLINENTMKRIICVILTMEIRDEDCKAEKALKKYTMTCVELLNRIGTEIKEYMPKEYEGYEDIYLKISEELSKYDDKDSMRTDKCKEALETFRQNMEMQYGYQDDLCIKIDKMLLVCKGLIDKGEHYINQLYRDDEYPQVCDREFLKEDYDTAWQMLSVFREKMKNDAKMAQLDNLYHQIADYLERLYETGRVTDSNLNRESIRFLLKMFYNCKFQYAESGGKL
ncbi:MAG: hypothetical protein NC434_14910 [Ruminococcus sp.]|nr:hypothetical protein [Ruminococcus sp.]MCM1156483.1 hypothetical protein [Roseburia sp.]